MLATNDSVVLEEVEQRLKTQTARDLARQMRVTEQHVSQVRSKTIGVTRRMGAFFGYELAWRKKR